MRWLLVHCHPLEESFIAACRDRLLAGAATAGHQVRVHDLYREDWDLAGDLAAHQADLGWCEVLVVVYPTWWSGQPGMLTDWIGRCWPPRTTRRNIRRIIAVTSHGSPKWINVLEGESGKRVLSRWVRPACSRRTRLDWLAFYDIDTSEERARLDFLERVERTAAGSLEPARWLSRVRRSRR